MSRTDPQIEADIRKLGAQLADLVARTAIAETAVTSQRVKRLDTYYEPPVAGIARDVCQDILDAAQAQGLGGCELCRA